MRSIPKRSQMASPVKGISISVVRSAAKSSSERKRSGIIRTLYGVQLAYQQGHARQLLETHFESGSDEGGYSSVALKRPAILLEDHRPGLHQIREFAAELLTITRTVEKREQAPREWILRFDGLVSQV